PARPISSLHDALPIFAAEKDAQWHLDRTFHNSLNHRVLHDVLLSDSRSDSWCQIDHLVIGRLGHFLVMETKSAVQGMSLHAESRSEEHTSELQPRESL